MINNEQGLSSNFDVHPELERIESNIVILISGPGGVGKDYVTNIAVEKLSASTLSMITTRPARENETKVCISDVEFDEMIEQGGLIGVHENSSGHRYAYRLADINANTGTTIMEINPLQQDDVVDELRALGVNVGGWIGITADGEYLRHNITERGDNLSVNELDRKIEQCVEIANAVKLRSDEKRLAMLEVGWHNRDKMADLFLNLIGQMIQSGNVNA